MKKAIGWALALMAPAGIWSSYLFLSRLFRSFSAVSDYSMLLFSVVLGALGVSMLMRARERLPLTLSLYVVLTVAGLYLGRALTVCSIHDCP